MLLGLARRVYTGIMYLLAGQLMYCRRDVRAPRALATRAKLNEIDSGRMSQRAVYASST